MFWKKSVCKKNINKLNLLKGLRNYKRKLSQKQAKTQPTFQNCCFSQ